MLWPAAIATLPVAALLVWQPWAGKGGDLLQYVAQGTVVPLLLLIFVMLERRLGQERLRTARIALGCIAVAAATALLIWRISPAAVILSALQIAVTYIVAGKPSPRQSSWLEAVALALVVIVAWTAALTLIWWASPAGSPVQVLNGSLSRGASATYSIGVLVIVLALVILSVKKLDPHWRGPSLAGESSPEDGSRRWRRWLPGAVAAGVFAFAAFQTFGLATPDTAMSWGFYVGPAELVRQGGWLLWDVPSQYGVLSVLAIAWLPTGSPWLSLFLVNAAANLLLALLVYWILRRPGAGWLDWLTAVAITLAAVFLRAGLFPYFAGPPIFPSTGGYRFLLCVALLGVLMRITREPAGRIPGRWLVAGTVLWLAALAWSVEAGFYATAAWLPAYLLLAWRAAHGDRGRRVLLIAAPFAAVACAIGALAAVYLVGLGHLPDLRAYLEYASAYAGGFGALLADPSGPALALLFFLLCLGALWVRNVRLEGLGSTRTAFLTGAFFAVWATSSYFASRSHPNNAVNLAPIYVVSLFGAMKLMSADSASRSRSYLRAMLVPVAAALMIGALGYLDGVGVYVTHPPDIAAVQSTFWRDTTLVSFMESSGISPDASIVLVDDPLASQLPPQRAGNQVYWLPIAPYGEIDLLPIANRTAHLERFVVRNRASGWLITDRAHAGESAWLRQDLLRWYTPTHVAMQGAWTATYYQYRGAGP